VNRSLLALSERKNFLPFFVTAELLLVLAIPFMLIDGYHTFLGSDAGTFLADIEPDEPGWRQLVESTDVSVLIESDQGITKSISLLVPGPGQTLNKIDDGVSPLSPVRSDIPSGYVLNMPTGTTVSNKLLGVREPEKLVIALSREFKINIKDYEIVNSNEKASHIAQVFEDSPASNLQVQTLDLPTQQAGDKTIFDTNGVEQTLRSVVTFPAGAVPGDRLPVRLINRVQGADVNVPAVLLGSYGFEVIEVGNAGTFDLGSTTMVVPVSMIEGEAATPRVTAEIERLASLLNVDIVVDDSDDEGLAITILAGADFGLNRT